MRMSAFASLALGVSAAALLSSSALAAADGPTSFAVMKEVKHDLSPPLREMQPPLRQKGLHRVIPIRPIPLPSGTNLNAPDGAMQIAPAKTKVSTTDILNFAGVGQGD